MADFNALEALINANIKKNGVQAITGNILNGILRGMVSALGKGYTIAGSVTPSSDPGTMTGPVAYIAYTAGTYTHFDGLEVEQGEVAMLIYNEAEWHKEVLYSLAATATVDGNVGTPEVGVSFVDGLLTFNFRNMKGEPGVNGQDGEAAGFGAVTASVDASVGTPSVTVSSSGPNTAKSFAFSFHNLKGEQGVQGIQGIQGPQGVQGEQGIQGPVGVESCVVTVDNTSGTPSCSVSLVGQVLHLDFTGLKGLQGDTGSSVDYPFTIVNNLTTNDATQALSAAMGVQLESEVSQLEAKVDESVTQELVDEEGFYLVDANYNIGLQFKGGVLTVPTKYKGKRFSFLGDSITTFGVPDQDNATGTWTYPGNRCRYPQNDLFTDVKYCWWKMLVDKLGAELGINESWAGSRVSNTSATDTGDVGPNRCISSLTRIGHLDAKGTPDVIIVYAGTNDIGNEVAIGTFDTTSPKDLTEQQIAALGVTTFADAFRAMLIRLQYYYRTSRIIVCLPNFTNTYYTMSELDNYIEVIREACDYFGVEYIDLRASGITIYNRNDYLPDGTHPNAAGMELLFTKVYNYLMSN